MVSEAKNGKLLNNAYVKVYYDTQVASLDSYTKDRWFSSVVGMFDYKQTQRAIHKALHSVYKNSAIEIGPGDAVWTPLIKQHVNGPLHLIEQSEEMLTRAKRSLKNVSEVTFERSDFMDSRPPFCAEMIVALRCFEYFTDKPAALAKMKSLLTSEGLLVIVTKNADMYTTSPIQNKTLHSAQISKSEMVHLLEAADFQVTNVFPAVIRWKAAYFVSRIFFSFLHRLLVFSGGAISIPFLEKYATESFVYVAKKK